MLAPDLDSDQVTEEIRDVIRKMILQELIRKQTQYEPTKQYNIGKRRADALEGSIHDKLHRQGLWDYQAAVILIVSLIQEGALYKEMDDEDKQNSVLINAMFTPDKLPSGLRACTNRPCFAEVKKLQKPGNDLEDVKNLLISCNNKKAAKTNSKKVGGIKSTTRTLLSTNHTLNTSLPVVASVKPIVLRRSLPPTILKQLSNAKKFCPDLFPNSSTATSSTSSNPVKVLGSDNPTTQTKAMSNNVVNSSTSTSNIMTESQSSKIKVLKTPADYQEKRIEEHFITPVITAFMSLSEVDLQVVTPTFPTTLTQSQPITEIEIGVSQMVKPSETATEISKEAASNGTNPSTKESQQSRNEETADPFEFDEQMEITDHLNVTLPSTSCILPTKENSGLDRKNLKRIENKSQKSNLASKIISTLKPSSPLLTSASNITPSLKSISSSNNTPSNVSNSNPISKNELDILNKVFANVLPPPKKHRFAGPAFKKKGKNDRQQTREEPSPSNERKEAEKLLKNLPHLIVTPSKETSSINEVGITNTTTTITSLNEPTPTKQGNQQAEGLPKNQIVWPRRQGPLTKRVHPSKVSKPLPSLTHLPSPPLASTPLPSPPLVSTATPMAPVQLNSLSKRTEPAIANQIPIKLSTNSKEVPTSFPPLNLTFSTPTGIPLQYTATAVATPQSQHVPVPLPSPQTQSIQARLPVPPQNIPVRLPAPKTQNIQARLPVSSQNIPVRLPVPPQNITLRLPVPPTQNMVRLPVPPLNIPVRLPSPPTQNIPVRLPAPQTQNIRARLPVSPQNITLRLPSPPTQNIRARLPSPPTPNIRARLPSPPTPNIQARLPASQARLSLQQFRRVIIAPQIPNPNIPAPSSFPVQKPDAVPQSTPKIANPNIAIPLPFPETSKFHAIPLPPPKPNAIPLPPLKPNSIPLLEVASTPVQPESNETCSNSNTIKENNVSNSTVLLTASSSQNISTVAPVTANLQSSTPISSAMSCKPSTSASCLTTNSSNSGQSGKNVAAAVIVNSNAPVQNPVDESDESDQEDDEDDSSRNEDDDSPGNEEDWRDCSILAVMGKILFNDERKDVTFLVGPDKEPFMAHKYFLNAISAKLKALVYPPNHSQVEHLTIPLDDENITPEAFWGMLNYIYRRRVDLVEGSSVEKWLELLHVASTFDLIHLSIICTSNIRPRINNSSVTSILDKAVQLGEEHIKKVCLSHIFNNETNILNTRGFLDLSLATVDLIFQDDNLSVGDGELEVFFAAIRWAEHQINKEREADVKPLGKDIRDKLGNTLHKIRFPLLTHSEYTYVNNAHILDADDSLLLYFYVTKLKDENQDGFRWNLNPRKVRNTRDNKNDEKQGDRGEQNELIEPPSGEPPSKRMRLERNGANGGNNMDVDEDDEDDNSTIELNSPEDDDDVIILDDSSNSSLEQPGHSRTLLTPKKIIPKPLLSEEEEKFIISEKNSQHGLKAFERYLRAFGEKNEIRQVFRGIPGGSPDDEPNSDKPIVMNCKELFPLLTPLLAEFHVRYLQSFKTAQLFKDFVKNLNVEKSIFFVKKNPQSNLSTLWKDKVNVTININGTEVLGIDHYSQTLVISRINAAKTIIQGLKEDSPQIKHIFLEEVSIDSLDEIPTDSLQSMTLRKVKGIKRPTFLQRCKALEKFHCDDMEENVIDFGIDIGLLNPEGSKMKKVALGKAKIQCSKPDKKLENSSIEELYLDNCKILQEKEFVESIPFLLPNLRRFKICSRNASLKFILGILELPKLEWIAVWALELLKPRKKGRFYSKFDIPENNKIIQILTDADFDSEPDKAWLTSASTKSFILEKILNESDGSYKWKGEKLTNTSKFEVFTKLDYSDFSYAKFYDNYELFYTVNV